MIKNLSFLTLGLLFFQSVIIGQTPGSLDLSFDPGLGAGNSWIEAIDVQSDGKILLGGSFTLFNGVTQNRLVRINANGTVDNTFNISTGPSSWVKTITVLPSNNILISGDFSSYSGTPRNYVAQVNTNGSLNTSFTPSTIPGSFVNDHQVLSDGKILVAGIFTRRISRLNSNGTNDTTFNNGTGANDWIYAVAVQSDGKIIIGGIFSNYNGTPRQRVARLNADGTLDSTFDPNLGPSAAVRDICIQPDGKIILVGEFATYNGTSSSRIVRLNTNGTIDNTFSVGTGASGNILSCALQSDNKILIAGNFASFNGNSSNRLARLNTNGSFDSTFNVGSGAGGTVRKVFVLPNGNIMIGGDFTTYNGTTRNRVARVFGGNPLSINTENSQREIIIYPNPTNQLVNIDNPYDQETVEIKIFNLAGGLILTDWLNSNQKSLDVSHLKSGVYLMQFNGEHFSTTKKLIVNQP